MVIIDKGFLEDVRGRCEKEGARKDREAEDIAFFRVFNTSVGVAQGNITPLHKHSSGDKGLGQVAGSPLFK